MVEKSNADEQILSIKKLLEEQEQALRLSFVNMLKEIDFDKIEAKIITDEQRKVFEKNKCKIEAMKQRYL